jgi:hypothetical protein
LLVSGAAGLDGTGDGTGAAGETGVDDGEMAGTVTGSSPEEEPPPECLDVRTPDDDACRAGAVEAALCVPVGAVLAAGVGGGVGAADVCTG